MLQRLVNSPSLAVLLTACALSIMTIGGCPVAQTPNVNGQANDNANANSSSQNTQDQGLPRPIPPVTTPPVDTDTSTSPPPAGGGQTPGGQTPTGTVTVTVSSPGDALKVRADTNISLRFNVQNTSGALQRAERVVARDDDANGSPDGGPIEARNITVTDGLNTITVNSNDLLPFLGDDGFGRFRIGVRTTTVSGTSSIVYADGLITVDTVVPQGQWEGPLTDDLVSRDTIWEMRVTSNDNAPHTVRILLDPDDVPLSGNEFELVPAASFGAGSAIRTFSASLAAIPPQTYRYLVVISDGIAPATSFYAPNPVSQAPALIAVTNRIIGDFPLEQLVDSPQGAITQGFNFNDLAGSSIAEVGDLNGDGNGDILMGARFGKPRQIQTQGIGWGEGYIIYGAPNRLRGTVALNSIGGNGPQGMTVRGIRAPLNTKWTQGLADVTTIGDMDGDGLPELAFSFPRVESVSLNNEVPTIQHPELRPGAALGLGSLEFDAYDAAAGEWRPNLAQFTRGGVVIVSSQNTMLTSPTQLDRRFNRVLDLQEIGQVFTEMGVFPFVPVVHDIRVIPNGFAVDGGCDGMQEQPQLFDEVTVNWDLVNTTQGPGGFMNAFTLPAEPGPPLANYNGSDHTLAWLNATFRIRDLDPCADMVNCHLTNQWYQWPGLPCWNANTAGLPSQWLGDPEPLGTTVVWTGFYQLDTTRREVQPDATTSGARILGQGVDDRFGYTIGSDGAWLYIAAPNRSARRGDVPGDEDNVPQLPVSQRDHSGVIYQLRADSGDNYSTQLWIEFVQTPTDEGRPNPDEEPIPPAPMRQGAWPRVDKHRLGVPPADAQEAMTQQRDYGWTDFTMPVPHQYIIETIGSIRGDDRDFGDVDADGEMLSVNDPEYLVEWPGMRNVADTGCAEEIDNYEMTAGAWSQACVQPNAYQGAYEPGTSGYWMDNVQQIVGPHAEARISFVRGVGDVDDDGFNDFAVGSEQIRDDLQNADAASGPAVGAVFVISGRTAGLEGDVLLERLALDPTNPDRLRGVLVKGDAASGDRLARVFDAAGDFNNDGISDIIIGNDQSGSTGQGEVIILLGSREPTSPVGGWTPATVVAEGRAIRFVGAQPGDLAGANVATAGDFDGDNVSDILIAAPGAEGGKGAVYLVYGSSGFQGGDTLSLADVGTVQLQGVRFLGRRTGDFVGGGTKVIADTVPDVTEDITVFSRGVAKMGDLDGDGRGDIAISAMLADPLSRTDSGEVYILYGRGD